MFEVIGITKIDKPPYFERIWKDCNSFEERVAPILGFYQVTINQNNILLNFEAEIRNTSENIPQIIFSDGLSEFLTNFESSSEEDKLFEVFADLIFEFHCNSPMDFPIKIE